MPSPFKRRKWLITVFVVIIIAVMLFSVFGVVVLYLNGTMQPVITPTPVATGTTAPIINPIADVIEPQTDTGAFATGTQDYQINLGAQQPAENDPVAGTWTTAPAAPTGTDMIEEDIAE